MPSASYPFHDEADIRALDLSDVDVLLECTGAAGNRAVAERGLEKDDPEGKTKPKKKKKIAKE